MWEAAEEEGAGDAETSRVSGGSDAGAGQTGDSRGKVQAKLRGLFGPMEPAMSRTQLDPSAWSSRKRRRL